MITRGGLCLSQGQMASFTAANQPTTHDDRPVPGGVLAESQCTSSVYYSCRRAAAQRVYQNEVYTGIQVCLAERRVHGLGPASPEPRPPAHAKRAGASGVAVKFVFNDLARCWRL